MKGAAIIWGLCLVSLLTAVGCGGNKSSATLDTRVGVSALTALADSHIAGYLNPLETLAMTQEIQSGDWQQMVSLLRKVEQGGVPATVWFVLPDGSYFTVDQGKTSQNLSDRAYFPGLMAGRNAIGDIVISKSTGKISVVVAVPVMKEGKVIGGLGAAIFLVDLSNILSRELGLPGNSVFYAITDAGQVALNSDTAMIMAQNPTLSQNVQWQTSRLTGWRFALGYKTGSSTNNLEFDKQIAVAVVHSSAVGLGEVLKNYRSETDRTNCIRAYVDQTRFYPDQSGYFFVYNFDCVNIALPNPKDLEGQNLYNYQDSKGNFPIRELSVAARKSGGFVEYYWVKPGSTSTGEQRKISYVEPIPGTDYFIGTGVYLGN